MKYKVGDLLKCNHSHRLYVIYETKCETYFVMDVEAGYTTIWSTMSADNERFIKKVA